MVGKQRTKKPDEQAEQNEGNRKKWAKLQKKQLKLGKKLWKYWDTQGLSENEVIAMADYLLDRMTINDLTGEVPCKRNNTKKTSKHSKKS